MMSSVLMFACIALIGLGTEPQPPDTALIEADAAALCAHARADIRRIAMPAQEDGGIAGLPGGDGITDVLHYNLDLEIIPTGTTLIGTNVMTVKSLINGLTTFDFSLHQNFALSSLLINGSPAGFSRAGATVHVTLDHAYSIDEQFDLTVSYSGVPISEGSIGSIRFTTQSGNPLIYTLSEPFYAHTWWPLKDNSRDKATGEMAFTVPNALKVASNGLLQGVDVIAGDKLKYRWLTNYQTAPYLFCFSATVYTEFGETWDYKGGSMPMLFYIYPASDTPGNRSNWLQTKPMLTVFSDLFGEYPFAQEKYGMCQFGYGGGMEHQTMTGQGTFSVNTTAHELGHQWWGDMITCGSWHDIWLNEGFATYSEALWLEFQDGSTGTPALIAAMVARKPTSMNVTVYRTDISSIGTIFSTNAVYRKGAWVLHMLRHIVGDTQFFQIMNAYRQAYEYDNAITDDFQAVAESVHGSSLEWFFQPWVFETGAPTYQWAYRNITAGGANYVELYLKQNQTSTWPTYAMPVDIRVTINAVQSFHTVWNDARDEHLLFPVSGGAPISALAVDPNNYILHPTISGTPITFLESPPKIVSVTPAPGTSLSSGSVSNIQVTFHKNVNAIAANFSLSGSSSGSIPFSFAYDSGTFTATLTPTSSLLADAYTLTINETLTGVAGTLALDGEVTNPGDIASLPTGDGLPGGNAEFSFTILSAPCPGDVALPHNSFVNVDDLLAVINSWGQCPAPPTSCPADVAPAGGNGFVNVDDLLAIINAWGACP